MIEIKKILFPTDFSEYSQFALKYAAALAESSRAKLYVMHVHERPVGSGLEAYHYAVPEYDAGIEKSERESLDQVVGKLRSRGVDADPVFIVGRAYVEIVNTAKELDVDLITLATHGRKGLSHVVFGSTAEKVVRLAPCPVLTVKHPEHDFVEWPDRAAVSSTVSPH
jgi:nucleotide-binding universal stress UspA family protein